MRVDDVGERPVVVPVLVGGDHGGQPGVADEGEQGLRLVGRVDEDLLAGAPAAQQVGVVGHLLVDRDLGDRQVRRAPRVGERRPGSPLRCRSSPSTHPRQLAGRWSALARPGPSATTQVGPEPLDRPGRRRRRPRAAQVDGVRGEVLGAVGGAVVEEVAP